MIPLQRRLGPNPNRRTDVAMRTTKLVRILFATVILCGTLGVGWVARVDAIAAGQKCDCFLPNTNKYGVLSKDSTGRIPPNADCNVTECWIEVPAPIPGGQW